MPVEIGAQAPDFELKDQNNQVVRLSSYRGSKNVVLVFYPLTFTGVCQNELCGIRDEHQFGGGRIGGDESVGQILRVQRLGQGVDDRGVELVVAHSRAAAEIAHYRQPGYGHRHERQRRNEHIGQNHAP